MADWPWRQLTANQPRAMLMGGADHTLTVTGTAQHNQMKGLELGESKVTAAGRKNPKRRLP